MHIRIVRPLLAFGLLFASWGLAASGDYYAYVGTYTGKSKSKGIYVYRFNTGTGKLSTIGLAAETENPSFLTIHQNGRYLYAVNEIGRYQGQATGTVTAFSIDRSTGKLTELNKVVTKGTIPCHLKVDKTGRYLVLANYGSGSTASFPIQADGKLGEAISSIQHTGSSVDERRQKGPHAHSVNFSPDYRFVVVADLGLDEILVYRFNPKDGTLTANDPPFVKVKAGGGPRHFSFHPTGRYGYANHEMGSAVSVFDYNAKAGVLTEKQLISTLPEGFQGTNHTAEVLAHPNGKFVYSSNRGHDSIAVYSVDRSTGKLTSVEIEPTQGRTPRNFVIDPSGKYLLAENQDSDSIVIFQIDPSTGALTATGDKVEAPMPVCIRFLAVK
jgi:6-phosphogluconolactonase